MRNIFDVVDQLIACDPDLEPHLRPVMDDMAKNDRLRAPELVRERWTQIALILGRVRPESHPMTLELIDIFNGSLAS